MGDKNPSLGVHLCDQAVIARNLLVLLLGRIHPGRLQELLRETLPDRYGEDLSAFAVVARDVDSLGKFAPEFRRDLQTKFFIDRHREASQEHDFLSWNPPAKKGRPSKKGKAVRIWGN